MPQIKPPYEARDSMERMGPIPDSQSRPMGDPHAHFLRFPATRTPTDFSNADEIGVLKPAAFSKYISNRGAVIELDPRERFSAKQECRPRRRLVVILIADAAGYCRLMHLDEAATVMLLNQSKCMMTQTTEKHGGNVVDSPGDNLLAAFGSVVAAVQCAVAMQQRLEAMNQKQMETRRMHFRMGLHLGDVICQGTCIYGEAINIAARLQSVAEPGGIRISRAVYEQVVNKLDLNYENLGERYMKNIPHPIAVYRVKSKNETRFPA